MKKIRTKKNLEEYRKRIKKENSKFKKIVTICGGTGCHAYNCEQVKQKLRKELVKNGLLKKVALKVSGCHGFCENGPIVTIRPENIFYQRVSEKDVPEIMEKSILKNKIVEHLLYEDPVSRQKVTYLEEIPFYKSQKRLLLGKNGLIEPDKIEDYIVQGGYGALVKVLKLPAQKIIEIIKASGLRGRGGGGFPTGRKWEFCRNTEGEIKYVICNCDEGDPGAYMDRSLLEGNPHSVIEGMIIGAFAIGSNQGYIYVRHEYPLACRNAQIAIRQARKLGLLGKNILGSGFNFDIQIAKGGGAFVCGESTALIASLEGRMGEPRDKQHLHTTESGLWGKPTNINNVETWANVPLIINNGPEWFYQIGNENSKGTKIFSLVGKVQNTGLVEVPMGTTLREIIFEIGGGILNGKKFKAVQTGGPSGGCVPADSLDLPVDYEQLNAAGSMMGSGGMIVMDEDTCMVDVAKYFLNFLKEESCGKCLPCREGIKRMLEIVTDISEGRGKEDTLDLLEELSAVVTDTSLCGLGKTAANPVLSTLRYFRDEYENHIKEKKCPAGVCVPLLRYEILADCCKGCGACIKICPYNAISGKPKEIHIINQDICAKCGSCKTICKFNAVQLQ
ncbi:MAG TPA: NADH-quinone oxidoreductase subunit F [Elusimicrobia bacterium]|jgi:NADH-quinone oxidoreductase subunit F|nr:NADH-quinone oxidoreductase subunit F [Elusimicrobiota bacterium]